MKPLLIVSAVICALLAPVAFAQAPLDPGEATTIVYNQDGHRFTAQLDRQTKRLILSLPINPDPGQAELEILKAEVVRLTYRGHGPSGTAPFGDSGFSLKFSGTYPVWGPGSSYGPDGKFRCLYFANNARIEGRLVFAQGENSQPDYHPYPRRPAPVTGLRITK